jgi:diguanylate cyclase (GGDEF)-like protein
LLNRRAIFEKAERLLAAAAHQHRPLSFIMLDIDHFKSINDIWGHSAGDDILRSVATVLKKRLRESDLLGRMGGEEFLAVLPETNLEGARLLAESLRIAVEQYTVRVVGSQPLSVTISLGIAMVDNPQPDEIDAYIKQADRALYHSKHTGRNRVPIATS